MGQLKDELEAYKRKVAEEQERNKRKLEHVFDKTPKRKIVDMPPPKRKKKFRPKPESDEGPPPLNPVITKEDLEEKFREDKRTSELIPEQHKSYDTMFEEADDGIKKLRKSVRSFNRLSIGRIRKNWERMYDKIDTLSEKLYLIDSEASAKKVETIKNMYLSIRKKLEAGHIKNRTNLNELFAKIEVKAANLKVESDKLGYIEKEKELFSLERVTITRKTFKENGAAFVIRAPLIISIGFNLSGLDLLNMEKEGLKKGVGYPYLPKASFFVLNKKKIKKEYDAAGSVNAIVANFNRKLANDYIAIHAVSQETESHYIVWLVRTSVLRVVSKMTESMSSFDMCIDVERKKKKKKGEKRND